jgi:D-alanyl-D-alanine endopeptidase (penicillin-binding protein 7)
VVPIASITKLMTAMVVLDSKAPLTEDIDVTDEDRDYEKFTGSRLSVGSELNREDMLHIALMASENRAAAALSRYYPNGPSWFYRCNERQSEDARHDRYALRKLDRVDEPECIERARSGEDGQRGVSISVDPQVLDRSQLRRVHRQAQSIAYNSTNALIRNPSWDIGLQKTGFINEAGECMVMQTTIHGRPVSWSCWIRQASIRVSPMPAACAVFSRVRPLASRISPAPMQAVAVPDSFESQR